MTDAAFNTAPGPEGLPTTRQLRQYAYLMGRMRLARERAGPFPRGQCFYAAYAALRELRLLPRQLPEDRRWKLCHGVAVGTAGNALGRRYGHAWLENGIWAYDPVVDRMFDRETYYAAGSIDAALVERYSWVVAMKHAGRTEHYGPWARSMHRPGVAYVAVEESV